MELLKNCAQKETNNMRCLHNSKCRRKKRLENGLNNLFMGGNGNAVTVYESEEVISLEFYTPQS